MPRIQGGRKRRFPYAKAAVMLFPDSRAMAAYRQLLDGTDIPLPSERSLTTDIQLARKQVRTEQFDNLSLTQWTVSYAINGMKKAEETGNLNAGIGFMRVLFENMDLDFSLQAAAASDKFKELFKQLGATDE